MCRAQSYPLVVWPSLLPTAHGWLMGAGSGNRALDEVICHDALFTGKVGWYVLDARCVVVRPPRAWPIGRAPKALSVEAKRCYPSRYRP